MIKLYDYILEASFGNTEYNKHNFKYRNALISDIISGKKIKLGKKNSSTDFWICQDLDKAKSLLSNYPDTVEDFDKIMKELNGPSFTKIFKGVYTGNDKEGQSDGELAESLVCYMYNNENSDEDFDKFCKLSNYKLSDIWKLSSKKTVSLMYKEWPKDKGFVAIHTDGNNKDNIDKKITDIALLFKSKKEASKIVHNSVDDMYSGSKKDKWNPADIILVNKNKINEIYNILDNEIGNGQALNSFLVSALKENSIIPISLKQVGKEAFLSSNNVSDTEVSCEFHDLVVNISNDFKQNTFIGSVLLKAIDEEDNLRQIQFRSQTDHPLNLSVEAKISNSARGGKGISVIKKSLNLNKNYYYINCENIQEIINNLKKFSIKVICNASDDIKPEIGKRPCISGLLGILTKYKEQEKEKYSPEGFFKFLWLNCTKCPGSYYIIH